MKNMEATSAIFERFHEKASSLLPSNLPGEPTSFQAYLKSSFIDPGNANDKWLGLHAASGSTRGHTNCAVRAFVAASFPPIKVRSFAGGCINYTFEGDAFPQFTHNEESNFSCAICIPHLKWAILISKPHSVRRAKSASTEAILTDKGKVEFLWYGAA